MSTDSYRLFFISLYCFFLLLTPLCPVWADAKYDTDLVSKYRGLKIGWLSQIPMFVTWTPESYPGPNTPFVVGIVGEELEDASSLLSSKRVNNRNVEVKRYPSKSGLQYSHILYISASQETNLVSIIQTTAQLKPQALSSGSTGVLTTAKYGILTISDSDKFLDYGGVIRFIPMPDKLGMEINLIAARKNGITISSQLLKLANKVIQ